MSDFSLRVVRADDLLVLSFEIFNLRLDSSAAGVPRLVRVAENREARVVVHFQPQHLGEEAFDENFGPQISGRIQSFMAGTSRLAFIVPSTVAEIPLTMKDLLDWQKLNPIRTPLAAPREPTLDETAIEMPYRVMLRPSDDGQWSHRPLPFAPGGRAELWHTSHARKSATPGGALNAPAEFGVSALWSPDLQFAGGGDDADATSFPMSLGAATRRSIVQQSASSTLFAEVLRLSALGGWLRVRGPTWNHDLVSGRDQNVRTEEQGVLYPFGHPVTLVTTSERKFATSNTGVRAAFVMQRAVLYIREPMHTYPDLAMPFKEIRISQTVIPIDVAPSTEPFVPAVARVPFEFPVRAIDRVDRVHQFAARMVYVPEGFTDAVTIRSHYSEEHARVELSGRIVGFARTDALLEEPVAPNDERLGPTDLRTMAMSFGEAVNSAAEHPLPAMTVAEVAVPAAEQLFGAAARPVTIALNKKYREQVLSGNPEKVFADIQDRGGLPLELTAQQAGGVASPKLALTAMSATHGAFPDVKALIRPDVTHDEIKKLLFGGSTLLGVIDLEAILGFSDQPDDLPQVTPTTAAVVFHWKPKLDLPANGLLTAGQGGTPELVLDGTLSGASAGVAGSLSNVALTFLGLLTVDFKTLTFGMQTGQSTTFSAQLNDFKFTGELEFVNKLQESLLEAFGDDGPSVHVTPQGVSAGFKMAIPTIPLGTIFLHNLALSAAVNLYFSEKPASVTFGLSSRKDPFIVTYTVFGGGGYFAFTVDTSEDVSLEAALEFGGAADIDVIIAKGVVQAMVGIRFELRDKQAILTGYVRIYGCVEILELVAISVEFYMGLTYVAATNEAIGEASLTVMVRVLAFSKSVTLHVTRRFSTDGATLAAPGRAPDMLSLVEWSDYCRSFAVA